MFHPIQTDQTTNSEFSRVFFLSKPFYAIGYEISGEIEFLVSELKFMFSEKATKLMKSSSPI